MTKIIFILLSLFLSTPCLAEHPCMQSLSSFPLTLILVFTPNVTNPFRSFRCPQQNYYNSQLISVFPVSPTTNPYGNLFPSNRLNILILLYHTLLKFIWRTNSLARPLMLPKPSSIYIYSFISYFPIQDSPLYTPPPNRITAPEMWLCTVPLVLPTKEGRHTWGGYNKTTLVNQQLHVVEPKGNE